MGITNFHNTIFGSSGIKYCLTEVMHGTNCFDAFLHFGSSKDPNNLFLTEQASFMFYFHFVTKLQFCHVQFSVVRSGSEYHISSGIITNLTYEPDPVSLLCSFVKIVPVPIFVELYRSFGCSIPVVMATFLLTFKLAENFWVFHRGLIENKANRFTISV